MIMMMKRCVGQHEPSPKAQSQSQGRQPSRIGWVREQFACIHKCLQHFRQLSNPTPLTSLCQCKWNSPFDRSKDDLRWSEIQECSHILSSSEGLLSKCISNPGIVNPYQDGYQLVELKMQYWIFIIQLFEKLYFLLTFARSETKQSYFYF